VVIKKYSKNYLLSEDTFPEVKTEITSNNVSHAFNTP
jgi:hypothetical protein